MSVWRVGSSVLALTAAGAVAATLGGDPPPPAGDIHLTPGTGESGMSATAVLQWELGENVAPQHVILRGTVSGSGITEGAATAYDPQGHDLDWVWDIQKQGDPDWATSTWTAPQRGMPGWYVKGVQYEKRTGFIFDEPGTYNIIVTCIRRSDGARATSSVLEYTVGDPNTFFTSGQTYVVSNDADFTGAPANAGTYSTIQAAWNAADSASPSRFRILVKRGTTGYGAVNTSNNRTNNTRTILFGTWGTGANPTLTSGHNLNCNIEPPGGVTRDWRFNGWDYSGNWNGANNTGRRFSPYFIADTDNFTMTIANSSAIDFGADFFASNNGGNNTYVGILNCVVDGFNGSASIIGGGWGVTVMGCRVEPKPDVWVMASATQGGGFGWRWSRSTYLGQVSQCDMFNRMSNLFSTGGATTQSLVRMNAGTVVQGGGYLNLNRCWIEGGGASFYNYSGTGSDSVWQVTQNVRSLYMLGTWDYFDGLFRTAASGLQVVTSVFIATASRSDPIVGSHNLQNFITLNDSGTTETGARSQPTRLISNTFVSFRDDAAATNIARQGAHTGAALTEQNNVRHFPFASSGSVNAGAFVDTQLFTPKYIGYYTYNATTIEPRTITATHVVELSGASGTFNEGTTSGEVTLTAPGTVTAKVAQRQTTGGVTRLFLYDVTGTIANGATVTVSSGGTGTAAGAMVPTAFGRRWQPTFDPGADAGQPFARVGILGGLQTTAFRGAWPQAV